ncbi:hypothetical protein NAS2_1397 [Conexivisphaera calida]|uniref:Uncharacterized protein n=1 Tax=Conexivisphaera calida TaxID=1874277 RepID=A0A4P2VE03_9ARCH|nr:hypothetical protein NAS2_1397 [Conexivisphaera calida]
MALSALMAHLGALVDGRTARNAKYSSEALMRCLIHLSARGAYAESGLGALADEGRRVPSPDTLFYRLERVGPLEALEAMNDANAELLGHAPRGRGIPPMVAIDYTEEPYYAALNMLRKNGLVGDVSVNELLFELSRVFMVKYSDGSTGLSEVPKKVERLVQKLGIDILPKT